MYIIGISAFYHDSSACLIKGDEIIAAAQEERFSRLKNDSSFPENSINYCLKEAGINYSEVDYFVFYEKPFLKFERIFENYLSFAPLGFSNFYKSMPLWIKEKIFLKKLIIDKLNKLFHEKINLKNKVLFSEHHLSHASSAFYPSPFENAAILTIDGVGEWTTTSISHGNMNKIKIIKEISFPHSLGLLYSAFTTYVGFKVNSGEYKLMGLAPYGKPIYADIIKKNLIHIKDDGSFQLDISYFNYCKGNSMTNVKFHKLFGRSPRKKNEDLTQFDMDLAASIQLIIEEVVILLANEAKKITGEKYLCLAGGVALNCVANGKIYNEKIFEKIWVQPASGDAGGSLGAAYSLWYDGLNNNRRLKKSDSMKGSLLGPSYSSNDIERTLKSMNLVFEKYEEKKLLEIVSKEIAKGKAVGWMQGRMEFGPRALGARSIIADPRSENMQRQLNLKVKFRESFRPFAPSVMIEHYKEWFDLQNESPYMLFVSKVNEKIIRINNEDKKLNGIDKLNIKRSFIPAVTHVDYSARVQTVDKIDNPKFYSLIKNFYEITGIPILINTSFNIRGEPIVCSPKDAIKCFLGTNIDILVIDNFYLKKERQEYFLEGYKDRFELD